MKSLSGNMYVGSEKHRRRCRGFPAAMGWATAVLLCWAGLAQAGTYQLQAASVPEHVFRYFLEEESLPRIEAFLDDSPRSRRVMFGDRQPHPLGLKTPGESELVPVDMALSRRSHPWAATVWDGEAGQLALFRVRGKASHYQKLKQVAVQIEGRLTQLPVRSVPVPPSAGAFVPATSATYLAHALENGRVEALTERRAESSDGLSVIVARQSDPHQADAVYLLVSMPQEGHAYKVILGWEDSGSQSRGGAG